MPKCVFTQEHFHWREARPPRYPWSKTIIYETHVRGFTIHPSSRVEHSGTYRGLIEKIPYFKDQGVTTALRYWVVEMHVDGFRFDLAAVLGRGRAGEILPNAPLLERIAEDPILREVKIIAEAWDAAEAYDVGSFSERR